MPHFPSTLRFVESTDSGYSVYSDRNGREHMIQDGTGVELFDYYDLDLNAEFSALPLGAWAEPTWQRVARFRELIAAKITEPNLVDNIAFCEECDFAADTEDYDWNHARDGERVCDSCISKYTFCEGCDEYEIGGCTDGYGNWRCQGCLDSYYRWCDVCEDSFHESDEDHYHDDDDCDCEVPSGRQFFVRNDGKGPLANDTSTTASLPSGFITDEGIGAIRRMLSDNNPFPNPLYYDPSSDYYKWNDFTFQVGRVGSKVQTTEGNFTKRLSKFAHKNYAFKISPAILSEVGNLAYQHSQGQDLVIEVTRDLNMGPAQFAHEGSCWWSEYSESRCALKSNGGFGLRSFGPSGKNTDHWDDDVTGRAWVMPMRVDADGELEPTFDTESPDAFLVFNGYGDLDGFTPARIVAHMAGWTYRKLTLEIEPMYVNSGSGYLVAPEEIADKFNGEAGNNAYFGLRLDQHADLWSREQSDAECNHFDVCNHLVVA